ncbi:hypothetical protein [Fluviicola taffensis]|uniref:Lipoprotein n=1 Tax=Fluviicola taffensis (strain DSM 16823 / NCIMB 13979 / RW262) TaxID=755732 RepID=F2IJ32_FLUTR|nr:hypothetical protein [Fluviicola taffensis]AEA43890.1 hypothetical protein Fluta_1903 [Fluviicola taffensis DSM 16823]
MRVLLIVLLGILFVSCGKKRSIHITATNAATGERYAGLQYYIVSSTTSGNGEKYKTEKSGFLNENGEATEIIREKQYRTYAVRVVEPESSCYNKEITMYFGGANDKNGHFDFEFAECAYLKFRYYNSSCQGGGDHIEVTRITNLAGYVGFYNPATYDGCADYTMPNFVQVPMGNWYFTWDVTKNGVTTSYSDTIFLAAGEYKYYEFNY